MDKWGLLGVSCIVLEKERARERERESRRERERERAKERESVCLMPPASPGDEICSSYQGVALLVAT